MKKFSLLSIFLALLMVLQLTPYQVLATQVEESSGSEETVQLSDETSEQTDDTSEPTLPVVTGNASVNAGCSSINAVYPLVNSTQISVKLGAALMYEMNSGTLIYALNPDAKMYPASVTKVMTCLLALEYGDINDIVTVSEEVVANRDPDGSHCNLVAGEEMSLKELLYCLMVASANDAGSVVSEYIAGSEEAFVELMNQKAQELGCTNTHFANPHGLHDENHYTTARDLAKIMLAALEYDLFREIYSTQTHEVPSTNKSEARKLTTTNYMMDKSHVEYYYDERVVGGKTGFTTPAGRCLAAVSEDGNMKLLTIALGGETGTNENGLVSYGSFSETGVMLDYGFSNFNMGTILTPDSVLKSFTVLGGENSIQGYVKNSVSTVLPLDANNTQLRYEYILDQDPLTAPVEADQSIGVVRVWYLSKCIAEQEMYALVGSQVKQTEIISDPAIQNDTAPERNTLWHAVLMIVVVLLAVIVVMLALSGLRGMLLRRKRNKRRKMRRRSR